ncbi:hypothetical protein ACA910_006072 [Epithemia clementina (nom. ined.)]
MAVKAEPVAGGGSVSGTRPSTPVVPGGGDYFVSQSPTRPPNNNNGDNTGIVLADFFFKQGSRSQNFWHERYFVLTVDGVLCYYNKKGDLKPKARLALNQLPDCEVSDLFVAKQKNQMLYCIKLTWTVINSDDDNDSVFSMPTVALQNDELENTNNGNDAAATLSGDDNITVTNNNESSNKKGKKNSIFRKISKRRSASFNANSSSNSLVAQPGLTINTSREDQPHRHSANNISTMSIVTPRTPTRSSKYKEKPGSFRPNTPGQRSIDGESLTVGSRARPNMPLFPVGGGCTAAIDEGDEVPRIPAMVEVQEENNTTNGDSEAMTVRAGNYARMLRSHDENLDDEMEFLRSQYLATEKEKKRITKRKVAEGAKYAAAAGAFVGVAVVTVGIGLVAGLVAMSVGAAAGASGTATGAVWKKKRDGVIVIGTPDYDRMRRWKTCLDASLASHIIQKTKWGQLFAGDGSNKRRMLIFPKNSDYNKFSGLGDLPSPDATVGGRDTAGAMFSERTATAKWRPLEGGWASFLGTGPQGLRILREEQPPADHRRFLRNLSIDGQPCPAMKSHLVLNATPLDAFLCVMSQGQLPPESGIRTSSLTPNSGQRSSFRIIESIDDNTDVIHMVCNPLYLFPSWTSPRDFVLYRYWRFEEDGNFIICFESVQHKDCPPYPGYCRGVMHQVFTLSPNKKTQRRKIGGSSSSRDQVQECLMTAVVQVDPKGWIPIAPISLFSNQGYGDAFAVAALMQMLDIRDAIDQDRFIPVSLDDNVAFSRSPATVVVDKTFPVGTASIPHIDSMVSDGDYNEHLVNYDFAFSNRETVRPEDSPTGLATTPTPLPAERWAEPDANSFRVRGRTYKEDRKKINAGASIGRLVAVDVVQVDKPIYSGFTTHPKERVQLALQKEKLLKEKEVSDLPPFLFVVNIVLPGPPFYHGVFYYAIDDMSTIDGSDGTPSSLLCKKFIFGDSDSFRDKTFKLIPQIVEGNFIVRKAVGSTPAIMGKKLKQTYVSTERSFEVVLDCGSSPVATGVIRLSLGYAKTLVVDMGFLFEGNDEAYLPERLFGCARIRQLEFGPWLRQVEHVPTEESTAS